MLLTSTAIVGISGMLGGSVASQFASAGRAFLGTLRGLDLIPSVTDTVNLVEMDVLEDDVRSALSDLSPGGTVVNCVGITNKEIRDFEPLSIQNAIEVNSLFPHFLEQAARVAGLRVLQIATDCVYSGSAGNYSETAKPDSSDVYGMTKALGETNSPSVMNVRCSIIGPEWKKASSLFEWVRCQETGAHLPGYVNHFWNGVTASAFGRLALGVSEAEHFLPGTHHLVPQNAVSKFELLGLLAERLGRSDLVIKRTEADVGINRTLKTNSPAINESLWFLAGYDRIPTVQELVAEMPITHFFGDSVGTNGN